MDLIFTRKLFQSVGLVYAILFWKEELLGLDTLKTVAVRKGVARGVSRLPGPPPPLQKIYKKFYTPSQTHHREEV